MTTIWQQVRVYLVDHPDRTAGEIGDALGLRDTSVRHALHVAHERGQVRRSDTVPMTWWVGGEKPVARKAMPRLAMSRMQALAVETLRASSTPLSSAQLGVVLGLKRTSAQRVLERLAASPRKAIQRVQVRPRAAIRWRVSP